MMKSSLDVFGSFLGPKYSSGNDVINSVVMAFAADSEKGLSEKEFRRFLEELFKFPSGYYTLSDDTFKLFHYLIFMGGDYMCLEEFQIIWKYWAKTILCPRSVLFVMNMQNDYLHGNLSKLNGNSVNSNIIIDKVNALLRMKEFELVIYVLESHPENHISFIDNIQQYKDVLWPCEDAKGLIESDRSREDYEMGKFQVWDKVNAKLPDTRDSELMLWPRHCVGGTWAAQLADEVHLAEKALRVHTGTKALGDSSSPYWDWEGVEESSLQECLRVNNISDVYICGMPTDVCVGPTAYDSINHGFRTVYVRDACVGLDDVATANCEKVMKCQGVAFTTTHEVKAMLTAEDRKPEMALLSAINFSQAMKKLHVKTFKLLAAKDVQTKTEKTCLNK